MAEPLVITDPRKLREWLGKKLGPSDWLEITQERIDLFAEATLDKQWIHTDPERAARESPFKRTVAHGYLTLSLAPYLFAQIVRIEGVRHIVNPGIDHMRLRAPVHCGDRLRLWVTPKDLREVPGGGVRVTFALQFEVEGQDRPAAFGDAALVYYA
jgi:acyl dehydratase